jgi:branched-chain amino acid transport system permease protein
MSAFVQVALGGLVTGSFYGLLALGIVLIYRTTGVLNFAFGALAAVSASFMFVAETSWHLNFWLALILTLIFSPLLGMAMERLFARPVLGAPVFTKAIATLALALVLETAAQQIWPQLTTTQHFASPFEGHFARIGGVFISLSDVVVLLVTVAIMLGLNAFLARTRLGTAMRATADNPVAARIAGIPISLVYLATWGLSSLIGAIAGILFASQQELINVQFLDPLLIFAFIGAVLGGLESLPGALAGGVIVGLADNILAYVLVNHAIGQLALSDASVRLALIFAGFVLVLLLRPQGLLGKALLRRV